MLVRLDSRVQSIEAKIDTLDDQLSNVTHVLKKGQAGSSKNHAAERKGVTGLHDRSCSYYNKPRHDAITQKPDRDRRCINCGKLEHAPGTCWSKPKVPFVEKGKAECTDRDAVIDEKTTAPHQKMSLNRTTRSMIEMGYTSFSTVKQERIAFWRSKGA